MSVQVYGCNHVAIEVDDIKKAVAFYKDVFNLEKLDGGEGDAFFKLGEHRFLASGIGILPMRRHRLEADATDFHDPWGNRIQVVDLHDESLIWMLPYREVQQAGIKFSEK